MNILKGIALLIGFCALGAAALLFFTLGMLALALRDGFFAVVDGVSRRLRGESKPSSQPKVFYGGRDGVPNLVMDADGFVEPPQAVIQPAPALRLHVGHLIPADSPLNRYNPAASWGKGGASVAVMQPGGELKILEFPTDPVVRQRLIDSRPKLSNHDTLGGDTIVSIHASTSHTSTSHTSTRKKV
ncbi:hypothetical protein BH11CYA1_BH11CYA1_08200 [soil metagenome]